MRKLLIVILLVNSCLWAQVKENETSELELFLFKIGFQSLLNDVRDIKTQSNVNAKDLENLSNKMEYIYSQITKNNTQLTDDFIKSDTASDESQLKLIISNFEKRIMYLENNLNEKVKSSTDEQTIQTIANPLIKPIKEKEKNTILTAIVNRNSIDVYNNPSSNSKVTQMLKMNTPVFLEYCDKYGWCKINDKNEYLKEHLLKINE